MTGHSLSSLLYAQYLYLLYWQYVALNHSKFQTGILNKRYAERLNSYIERAFPSIRDAEGIVLDILSIVVGRIDDFDISRGAGSIGNSLRPIYRYQDSIEG